MQGYLVIDFKIPITKGNIIMKNNESAFFTPNGKPKLRLSYCAFMDIVGFKEIIQKANTTSKSEAILGRLHKVISIQLGRLNPTGDDNFPPDWYIKVFTDNIIIGQMIQSSDGEPEMGSIINAVVEFQLALALEGFFLRGGISIGEIFIDDRIVFGPALLEAHHIEHCIARDPRIVLSKDVIKLAKTHATLYEEPQTSPQNNEIVFDADGNAFIHYLAYLFDYSDDLQFFADAWDALEIHKNNIESGLKNYRAKPEVWSKYSWLANYHDYCCEQVRRLPGYNEKYRIDSRLLERKLFGITETNSTSGGLEKD